MHLTLTRNQVHLVLFLVVIIMNTIKQTGASYELKCQRRRFAVCQYWSPWPCALSFVLLSWLSLPGALRWCWPVHCGCVVTLLIHIRQQHCVGADVCVFTVLWNTVVWNPTATLCQCWPVCGHSVVTLLIETQQQHYVGADLCVVTML